IAVADDIYREKDPAGIDKKLKEISSKGSSAMLQLLILRSTSEGIPEKMREQAEVNVL
ncbi:unnamed protein product, partial [Amoebophrya sp. A25]